MATIYKILSPDLQECYVGSTIQRVERRWNDHRQKNNQTTSKKLFDKYGVQNCKFVVMEVCPIEEQKEKEQWWMDHSVGLVNRCGTIINVEARVSYLKEYAEEHREEKNQRSKAHYEENREKILAKQKAYYEANRERILKRQKAKNADNLQHLPSCK